MEFAVMAQLEGGGGCDGSAACSVYLFIINGCPINYNGLRTYEAIRQDKQDSDTYFRASKDNFNQQEVSICLKLIQSVITRYAYYLLCSVPFPWPCITGARSSFRRRSTSELLRDLLYVCICFRK